MILSRIFKGKKTRRPDQSEMVLNPNIDPKIWFGLYEKYYLDLARELVRGGNTQVDYMHNLFEISLDDGVVVLRYLADRNKSVSLHISSL